MAATHLLMHHSGIFGWRWAHPTWLMTVCAVGFTTPAVYGQKDMGAGHCGLHGNYTGSSCPQCAAGPTNTTPYQGPNIWNMLRERKETKANKARQKLLDEAYDANHQAIEFQNKGDWVNAIALYEKARRLSPYDEVIQKNLAHAQARLANERGKEYFEKGDWANAAVFFAEADRMNPYPNNAEVYQSNLSLAQSALKSQEAEAQDKVAAARMQQAISNFAQTLNTVPGGPDFDGRNPKSQTDVNTLDFISSTPPAGAAPPTDRLEFGDPNVVDLRGTTKTTIDPATVQSGIVQPGTNGAAPTGDAPVPEPPQETLSNAARLAQVQKQIHVLQETLRRLDDSMKLDPAQRDEWESESKKASRDAWVTAADLTLGLLGDRLDQQIGEVDQAIKPGLDPAALDTLRKRKDDLLQAKRAVDGAGLGLSTAGSIENSGEKLDPVQMAYDVCDKLNVFPGWAKQAKIALDASYEATVQAYSVQRLGTLNAHSEQYLAAVGVLGKKMEALVKEQQSLKHLQESAAETNP